MITSLLVAHQIGLQRLLQKNTDLGDGGWVVRHTTILVMAMDEKRSRPDSPFLVNAAMGLVSKNVGL
jgi:hypothetical protein